MPQAEDIPDPDKLFFRVHPDCVMNGKPIPMVFRFFELSTDWEKHSDSSQCQARATNPNTPADHYGVVSFTAAQGRSLQQVVRHDPFPVDQISAR